MEKFAIASPQTDSYPKKQSRLHGWHLPPSWPSCFVREPRQTVQPAVQPAILASLSTVALGIAFSEAVVATWWASAADGASLKGLHYIWDRGEGLSSFFSALRAGPAANKVATPLLQRATRQRIEEIVTRETMKLNVAQRLPSGWTGTAESNTSTFGSINGVHVTRDWWLNASISTSGSYCDGTCEGNLPGAGISYDCSSTTLPLNLLSNGAVVFEINTTLSQNSTGAPFLLLTILYSSTIDNNCTANLTIDTCNVKAGIVEYPITIRNSTIKPNSDKLNDCIVRSTYCDSGDLPTAPGGTAAGALRGLNNFAINFYSVVTGPSSFTGNLMAEMFIQTDRSAYDNSTYQHCALKWFSPTDYVLKTMHDYMFRAALSAAKDADSQKFSVWRAKRTLVFHSVYGYLAATTIATLFGVFFVLIRLLRWWSLGRTVSLSPLETAKAFSAPLMERARYNDTADEMLKDIGQIQVRYVDGVMVVDDDSTSLLTNS